MAATHTLPPAGALALPAPASAKGRRFSLETPSGGGWLELRLIVPGAPKDEGFVMAVTGPAVARSAQLKAPGGLYERVTLNPESKGGLTIRLGPSIRDRVLLVRRRVRAALPGFSAIRFPARSNPPPPAAAPDGAQWLDRYKADPDAVLSLLARLSGDRRREAALALLEALARDDAGAGRAEPLLMMLHAR